MWDSRYMAEMDNFSVISENFDTIKTLLNSIRAQGILNTSDVDKLLTGINTKLEKINTEEDIDLIKIFLSELKQNLDERHGVLVSKFSAIESLFSNLLKNSSEMPKSSDIKELFDIVATNLSVFSREVVSQKETLTDITLRIDALRSDDSQKKDIIKNIALLKPDLERLNNGFDSIVISLNDNFKTIIKTITALDKTEYFDKFSDAINSMEMASSTILSALQVLDKKTDRVEDVIKDLATKQDIETSSKRLFDLTAQSHELSAAVSNMAEKYLKFDSLSEKIDASVNIIATLKANIEEADNKNTIEVLEQIRGLQAEIEFIKTNEKFEVFKSSLELLIRNIIDSTNLLGKDVKISTEEIKALETYIKGLDIKVNFEDLFENLTKSNDEIKTYIDENTQKINTLSDANITRVLNDISSSADLLSSKLNQANSEISLMCEKHFSSVFENFVGLKSLVSQIDENSVSANNAIFSNITDRLTVFENALRDSLELQEKTVTHSSAQLIEQIDNIKNLSSVLDYKMDSSVVEFSNIKNEFSSLKTSVENVLALDFVTAVKDLRVDLYASKQELANSFETSSCDLSDKITKDFYQKYDLLISKIANTENEIKSVQAESLISLKNILDKISGSIIDVISYVSETRTLSMEGLDSKLTKISDAVTQNNLDYVERVRDIVDVIRIQIESSIKDINNENLSKLDTVEKSIIDNTDSLRQELKYSYSKLLEIQDSYNEIKELLNIDGSTSSNRYENIIASTETIKSDFESKLNNLKLSVYEKLEEFSQDLSCKNADILSDLKITIDNNSSKRVQEAINATKECKTDINKNLDSLLESNKNSLSTILEELNKIKESTKTINLENIKNYNDKYELLNTGLISLKDLLTTLDENSREILSTKVDSLIDDFSNIKLIMERVDENLDRDLTRQLSIIESNFESLVSQVTIMFDKSEKNMSEKINQEFSLLSNELIENLSSRIEDYKTKMDETISNVQTNVSEQTLNLQNKIIALDSTLKTTWEEQFDSNKKHLEDIINDLKLLLDENCKITSDKYTEIQTKIAEYAQSIKIENNVLSQELKNYFDNSAEHIENSLKLQGQQIEIEQNKIIELITENQNISANDTKILLDKLEECSISTNLISSNTNSIIEDLNAQKKNIADIEINAKDRFECFEKSTENISNKIDIVDKNIKESFEIFNTTKTNIEELNNSINNNKETFESLEVSLKIKIEELKTLMLDSTTSGTQISENILEQINIEKQQIKTFNDALKSSLTSEVNAISTNIEKETDTVISEIIEQFDLLKKSQNADIVNLTTAIEEVINSHFYNNIEDLKSYLDIKLDNSLIVTKLDLLKSDITANIEEVVNNISKLMNPSLFTTAINDYKVANEILINTAIDRINNNIESFIEENLSKLSGDIVLDTKSIKEKLATLDNNFGKTLVSNLGEIKTLSNESNDKFSSIQSSINNIVVDFSNMASSIYEKFDSLSTIINEINLKTVNEVQKLERCFEDLKAQISNKSFDEAFQASINTQVGSLESLIKEQFGYIEDLTDLCSENLPDVAEIKVLIENNILQTMNNFSAKIEDLNLNYTLENELKSLKSDLITQFINIFNQISFVTEQEEILDFIQEKHDELITILSHIVTNSNEIKHISENINSVDNKIDTIRNDIYSINEKITAIMSSDGDVDYIYSLHDLESDIANLRIILNDMKENSQSSDLEELINSTNNIYELVDSIKNEFPNKSDFDSMAEDLVSISSRTNKLILASDESYKTLQDNLQDFKLVINDLDERTRNFARESGIDRLDSKLNAINTMIVSGAKSNQVFNQVFEYLADWVDNASSQINSISNKVETLDDIGQIKVMLEDLKANSEDNSDSVELIETLGSIFDKQIKKISALESKLDRVIVETTINNKNNKIDMKPMEETLNRFLVAMDEKMIAQQNKIDSLESKLANAMSIIEEKDTAQLTKKVGGMDKQIAKLNKNIEKIASHVIEQ